MANKPGYLSNLTDRFKQLTSLKYLFKICTLPMFALIVLFPFSGFANASQNDSDGDGLSDAYELKIGLETYLSDTDGDEVKDSLEVGNDKSSPLDTDKDGIIDALDYDDDNDGLPTFLESKKDSDKDGLLDYLDRDSDNDGIPDGEEAGVLNQDKNLDGVDDAFDVMRKGAVDNNGDGIDDNVKLPDHNNDGTPDYLDGKYQNQKLILVKAEKKTEIQPPKKALAENKPNSVPSKVIKVPELKTVPEKAIASKKAKESIKEIQQAASPKPDDMIINRHTDSDNDGLSNTLEKILGTNHLSRDTDGDKVSDAIEIGFDINSPQDSDRDGIIDALDNDDDNDGILTKLEDLNKDSTAINDDTDGDGVPNYLDANDDGDNLLTKAEGSTIDSDGDGILDYLDKNDGLKDVLNQTVQVGEKSISNEPEIVVLFDGDAASLGEEDDDLDDIIVNDSIQNGIVGSLDALLEKDTLSGIDHVKVDDSEESQSTKTSSNKSTSHWILF